MIKLVENTNYSKYDYVFNDYYLFVELEYYLLPKLFGKYLILFDKVSLEDAFRIIETTEISSISNRFDIDIFLMKDVLPQFMSRYPSFFSPSSRKSNWMSYMDMISSFPKGIERKASSELFKRSRGNLDTIRSVLDKLMDDSIIYVTLNHVNKYIQKIETVYPRSVFLCAIYERCKIKHFLFNEVRYKNTFDLAYKVEASTSRELLFFSLRKLAIQLYKDKLAYLRNDNISNSTNQYLVRLLSYTEVTFIYLIFTMSSVNRVYQNLHDIIVLPSLQYFVANYLRG